MTMEQRPQQPSQQQPPAAQPTQAAPARPAAPYPRPSGPRPGGPIHRKPGGAPGGARRGRREGGRRFFPPRRRVCAFCVEKVTTIDYKDVARLRRFLSDRARIDPRRRTGTCAKHQRALSAAIKRARHLALLPFTGEQVRETGWTGL